MGQIPPVGLLEGHPRTQCPFCGVPAQDAHAESNPEETDKPKSGTYKKTDLSSPKTSKPWTSSTKLLQTGKTLRTLTSPHNRMLNGAHMAVKGKGRTGPQALGQAQSSRPGPRAATWSHGRTPLFAGTTGIKLAVYSPVAQREKALHCACSVSLRLFQDSE